VLTAVWIAVVLLMAVGLAGTVVPMLPGTPLILAGAAVHAIATGWDPIGPGRLVILAVLAGLGVGMAYVAGALGARHFGASRWAIAGAVIGALVGLAFAPLGLLVGPVVGAVAGELLRTRQLQGSLRSGLGALVGVAIGAALQLGLGLVMIGLFAWWVWRG
jgi:uncharacterized protein YqgC (DUF456 family)